MQSLLKTWGKTAGLAWLALTISGCGQKGPLYLPVSATQAAASAAASAASHPSNAPTK